MPHPVRSLPVIQNWDCHGCSDCCRTYHVRVTPDEKAAIDGQNWADVPEAVVWDAKNAEFQLNHKPDGACVFLGDDNRCRIHAKFGPLGKPLACRVYPFVPVPCGDHWRAGLRFACPSAAKNEGANFAAHLAEIQRHVADMEVGVMPAAPELQPGQNAAWPDLTRFADAVLFLLAKPDPVERKLRRVLNLARLCRAAKFEAVRGPRLGEFLKLVLPEVNALPVEPPPGWVGRMVFRQLVALYARKDVGLSRGRMAEGGVFGRLAAGWGFARGTGRIPRIHGLIPEGTTFVAAEAPAGPLAPDAEELLSRYYRVKVESMQFCGAANHGLNFWDGLDSLIVAFPATLWLARVLGGDVSRALRIVDDNFGYNPLLSRSRQAWAVQLLNAKRELPKLVAWYGGA